MVINLKSLLAGMVGGKVLSSSNREHPVVVVNQKEETSNPSEEEEDDSFDGEGSFGQIQIDTEDPEN